MNISRSLYQGRETIYHGIFHGINLYRDDVITSIETSLHIEATGKRWDCSWEFIKRQGPRFRDAYFVGGLTCTHLWYQVILLVWTDIEFIYKHVIL